MNKTKLLKIIPKYYLRRFTFLIFTSFLLLTLEILGLGMIIPMLELFNQDTNNSKFTLSLLNIFKFIKTEDLIIILPFLLIIIFIVKGIGILLIKYYQTVVSHRTMNILSEKYLSKILRIDLLDFRRKNKSDIIRDLNHETRNFCFGFLRSLLNLSTEIIIVFGLSIFLFILSPSFFLLIFITLSFFTFTYIFFVKKKIFTIGKKRVINESNKIQSINDIIFGIKEIRIYNLENFFLDKFKYAAQNYIRYPAKNSVYQQLPRFFLEIIFLISSVIFFLYNLINNNNFIETFQIMSVFAVSALRVIPSISSIATSIQSLQYNKSTINALSSFLELKEVQFIKSLKNELKINNQGFFEIKNLSFSYNEKIIFDNFSCKIYTKSVTGIIGSSGRGKTTFLDIISGHLSPSSGFLLLDRDKIYFNDRSWLSLIAYVSQVPYVFKDTIGNNIALGQNNDQLDPIEIIDILKKVNLYDFVSKTKQGINYPISDDGSNLSVGQKQRLGIARALYKNSSIVIFDEPTSSLDEDNKYEFIKLIKNLKNEKTIIIISHDEKLIDICDNVIKI